MQNTENTDTNTTLIGVDAKRIVRNATGLGNYCRTLIRQLASDYSSEFSFRLYAPDAGRDSLRSQLDGHAALRFVYPRRATTAIGKAFWRLSGMVSDLRSDGIRIFHGLSGELPIGLRRAGIVGIVTIHDLIFMRHPEYYHPWDALIYRWKFRRTCREARQIVAISECTKRDVMELGGVPADRIEVVYQDCDAAFKQAVPDVRLREVSARLSLPLRFMLQVGSIEERKNLLLSVKALSGLPEDVHLVAVGKPTAYAERVVRYARRHGLAHRLHLLHGVSHDDLPAIYRLASVFVYPSRYEGFGIPILEAIHSGLPVVACTGSCLEEAGGPDCIYVGPDDVQAMTSAVLTMLDGADREERIARSRAYVRRFEGAEVAQRMATIYRRWAQRTDIGM